MSIISAVAADEITNRREPVIAAMARALARPDRRAASEQHILAATALLEATLAALRDHAPSPADFAAPLDRSQLARFGDDLVAVLKDVIGHDLPPSAFSCVSDAYWRMVRDIGVPAK